MFHQGKALPALVFAALILLSGGAHADWHAIDTGAVRIVSELSPKQSQKILRDLDVYQVTVAQLLKNIDTRFKVPMTIVVLNHKSWQRYMPDGQGKAGIVLPRPGRVHMVIDGNAWTRDAPVLFHELSHVLLHQNSGGRELPTWYDEGYADLLSTIRSSGDDKVKFGGVPVWRWVSLQANAWMPLQTVLGVSRNSPEYVAERLAPSFYAGSWLILHYATFGDNVQRGRQIEEYRSHLGAGYTQKEAFERAFPDDNGAFEKELQEYSRRTTFKLAELKLSLPDTVRREPVKITDAEAFAAIADFKLAASRTSDEDLALFQQWAAGAAPDALPTLRLGALHLLRGEREPALTIANAGCTVRSTSYEVAKACGFLYYLAAVEQLPCRCEELMDLARQARYHYGPVLEQTPDDVESLLNAGTASIWAQRPDTLARAGLARAWLERKVRNDEIAYALAYLYMRDDWTTAKQYLELALMYSSGYQRQQQLAREVSEWSARAPQAPAGDASKEVSGTR